MSNVVGDSIHFAQSTQHQLIEPVGERGGILRQFTIENLRLLQQQK